MEAFEILEERKQFVKEKSEHCTGNGLQCDTNSVSGAVSQRACVYCGARVVLNPITDAYHIVHGPIGCASYTWDIRGSLTSDADVFRTSFSTDLREKDVIFGGEKKLIAAIEELIEMKNPKLIFVYATCIVGVIGDDVEAICSSMSKKYRIRVIPIKSSGFAGNKSLGYRLACNGLMDLISPEKQWVAKRTNLPSLTEKKKRGVNILGDFNLAGELWIIREYLHAMGVLVVATFTGDSSYDSLIQAPFAELNVVQCAGSSHYLAKRMEEAFGIPYINVSFFGIEDTTNSLLKIADALQDEQIKKRAIELTGKESYRVESVIESYREPLRGKKVAIYVGGGFKAISLIRQFYALSMIVEIVGTQTGKKEEYDTIESLVEEGTLILDDTNPAELERFMKEKRVDLLVGGVKERPLAYKLGIGFCDHNHERKHPLCGYEGVINFVKEIDQSINHPVWGYLKKDIQPVFSRRRIYHE